MQCFTCEASAVKSILGGARKLTGDNLKVVRAKVLTLILAVLVMSVFTRLTQARLHVELKTRLRGLHYKNIRRVTDDYRNIFGDHR